ncbi:hypothetical protein F5Y09DRAFT_343730 [Xylaria sp. FL1042]|nr:hypothetical protein F5Y09DRAFT_343730 [Xylaria sp. FL1042]
MQFFKSLLLAGLLTVQAPGAAVPIVVRDDIAPLPSTRTYVDINEARHRAPRQAQEFDKILGHVASKLCTDAKGPGIDDQITNIFTLHDQASFQIPEVYVLIPPPEMDGQQQFNEYVVESVFAKAMERNFIYSFLIRDQVARSTAALLCVLIDTIMLVARKGTAVTATSDEAGLREYIPSTNNLL